MPLRDVESELGTLAQGLDHPECVACFGGRVYCGTESGELLTIDRATGSAEVVAEVGGCLLGIAFDGDGNCYACDVTNRRIVRIDRDGGVESFVESVGGRRLRTPNYLAFDDWGQLWATDSGTAWASDDGFLFRIEPDGSALAADDGCNRFPNGIALSPSGDRLYLVESRLPGISVYTLVEGVLGERRELLRLPDAVPDGLAVDSDGRIYVGCWRPDRVYLIGDDAEPGVLLDDPSGEYLTTATNLCFDQLDGRTLFISGFGGWAIRKLYVDLPGAPPSGPGNWLRQTDISDVGAGAGLRPKG